VSGAGAALVIDTSVAVKWFFDEPHTADALRVLAACRAGSRHPVAPDLIYPEFGNAVWKRVIQGQVTAADGAAIVAAFGALPLEIVASRATLLDAYQLATSHRRTVYDATFLALSALLDVDLVTADEALHRAVRGQLPRLRWIGDWAE
jgi:predicted nucleic acid-binding protein